MYSVISVIVDSLPENTKNRGMDLFVAFGVLFFLPWAVQVHRSVHFIPIYFQGHRVLQARLALK